MWEQNRQIWQAFNDMSGNVWEWCWNIWKVDWPAHVDRGGGYGDIDDYCSVSFRGDDYHNFRYRSLGFRVCRGL